jgi:two-component system, OmpR family, sensor histidine kinase CpxA
MKVSPRFPLLAKVLGWLFLHLLILALAFVGFVGWQLGLGLDSLLSGSAGERLQAFGDSVREEIREIPRAKWNEAIRPLAQERNVTAAIVEPDEAGAFPTEIPNNVKKRMRTALPPKPGPPPMMGRGGPPPGHEGRNSFGPPPFDMPGGRETYDGRFAAKSGDLVSASRPVFLLRGDQGNGYWAGIDLTMLGLPAQPRRHHLLLIRAEGLDGSGMFFEFKPWLWGGLAVLVLSLAFWTPFVWSITRYVRRLTAATDRIAVGQFGISLPPRGNDELGNLGHAIEAMAGRLNHLVSGQKRFLGDAAHELCAPLARLRTGLGILEMKLDGDALQHLATIESDAQELATLVEEILAFSHAGNRIPRRQSVALKELVKEVCAREAGGILPEIRIPEGLNVIADATLLGRALGNLVRNARIHAGENAGVVIGAENAGTHTVIVVSDDGPGVSPEELPRLFEPFYRPDLSRTRDTGGSGLGLAIVRTAIEACGGEVSAFLPTEGGFSVRIRFANSAHKS